MTPRGRRPGDAAETRERILAAAREEFAEKGYDAVSLRGIARRAEVDPALLHHYFEGKADVFTQALDLPVNVPERVHALLALPREQLGENIVRTFLTVWDAPEARPRLQALIRGAVADEEAGATLREFIVRGALEPLARELGHPDPELASSLAAGQMVGVGMFRYVVPHPPLAQADADDVVALVGPTIQRYLLPDVQATPVDPGAVAADSRQGLASGSDREQNSSHGE